MVPLAGPVSAGITATNWRESARRTFLALTSAQQDALIRLPSDRSFNRCTKLLTKASPSYQAAFNALAQRRLRFEAQPNPEQAPHEWQTVVDDLRAVCNGYPTEIEEELESAREPLSTLVLADELMAFPEHVRFSEGVAALDAAILALTIPWPDPAPLRPDFRWWQGRVPKYWVDA